MTVKLNHTIVYARDKRASAAFLAELFGLPAPVPFGPFMAVEVGNEVTLDYWDADGEVASQPRKGKINTHDGGRGVYFEDPNGHLLEIITRPYGSG